MLCVGWNAWADAQRELEYQNLFLSRQRSHMHALRRWQVALLPGQEMVLDVGRQPSVPC